MNRYMHTDLYPDFHVTFTKKAKINEIPAVSLSDLGLPYDVDFKEQKLEDLSEETKDAIICEFVFLIDKLLPRDIQDLFYRIALDPRPAYWSAFEQAADLMQLERYDGHERGNQKGQFLNHVRQGIQDLIEDGFTLQEIYDSTCVTKDMVRRTAHNGFPKDYASNNRARWDAMEVEIILFGVKNIYYKVQGALEDNIADFCVYEDGRITLAIQCITDYVYLTPENRDDDSIEAIDKLILYCHHHNIPLLLIDDEEIEDFEFPHRLTNVIKQAIGNKEYCDAHNEKRKSYIREEWDSEGLCDFAAYQDAVRKFLAEPVLEYFQGRIKGMKLISNQIYYGPRPEPRDEIEQHLSLFADEVLVPVGKDGDLKSVYVESVELHTAEDAPFPIDKCKKVVRRI